jgi:hypothetical protein
MTRGLFLAMMILPAVPAAAQSRDMMTVYVIQPGAVPEGERELASGDYVVRQRLLPTGLAELADAAMIKPGVTIAVGTRLIEVKSAAAAIRCVAERQAQKLIGHAETCFVDADRDLRFESWFQTTSSTTGILTIAGRLPKKPNSLAAPVAYRVIDPALHTPELFVGIQRRNYFNIYGRENFMIVFGHGGETSELTTPQWVKAAQMPKELIIMGARFTALGETAGKMRVRVDAGMPAQPFGVTTTTTYTFIPG